MRARHISAPSPPGKRVRAEQQPGPSVCENGLFDKHNRQGQQDMRPVERAGWHQTASATYFAVGITNSAPLPMLSGQRCMMDFCLV